jgi:hypothetical protein
MFDISADQFREQVFGRDLYFGKSALQDISFGWTNLDDLIYAVDAREPSMKLFLNGHVQEQEYMEDFTELGMKKRRVRRDAFYSLMQRGATLVLNRLEVRSAFVKRLCMGVGQLAGHHATANGYLAFGGTGTFGKHWDTHDVMVLQLLGRKRWQVFRPTFNDPISIYTSKDHKHECPPEPVFDGILEAGDILYMPRGWWHEALPMEGEGTFHLAVGIHTPVILDYLIWLCGNALSEEPAIRAALSLEGDQSEKLQVAAQVLGRALLSEENLKKYRERIVSKERTASGFNLESLLGRQHSEIPDSYQLCVNTSYLTATRHGQMIVNGRPVVPTGLQSDVLAAMRNSGSRNMSAVYALLTQYSRQDVSRAVSELAVADILDLSPARTDQKRKS